MKSKVALVLAAVVMAASTAMVGTVPARAEVSVYTTPGMHNINGREWRTTCEPYSQTKRCRTEIKATQVSEVRGRFVSTTDWVFNNLTYLPSQRSLWKGNPLGGNGATGAKMAWTAPDGRQWSTECDTAITGSNGCRSYTVSKVIEAYESGGKWNYRWVTKSVFNNIVMFSIPTKPVAPATITVPDKGLRACINAELDRPVATAITSADAMKVTKLDCDAAGITHLTGLTYFSNLDTLWLDENNVKDLSPLRGLVALKELTLAANRITDVAPLAQLSNLRTLDLTSNDIRNLAPLGKLNRLMNLYLADNDIVSVAPLVTLQNLSQLDLDLNWITDVAPLAKITSLMDLYLSDNEITNITPLAQLPYLNYLSLDGNHIIDVAPLGRINSLARLGVADNQITKVAPLAKLENLEFLQVFGNPISDPESLDPLVDRGCSVLFKNPEA